MTLLSDAIEAKFWRPLEDGRIACDLCYRRCEIEPGAAGWCDIRRNEGGQMVLTAHGVLSSVTRQMNGYRDNVWFTYKPGRRGWTIGGTSCTSACSFCMSGNIALHPERVPWADIPPNQVHNVIWSGSKAWLAPAQVVEHAKRAGAGHVYLTVNEPTLTIEYSLDVARLAKQASLGVQMNTNGFTTPAAIQALAPYVDAICLGVKGSADPIFYERHMRSPGAVPHVLEALKTWKECGVWILVSDLLAPRHMQDYEALLAAQEPFYAWIAEELGTMTPVILNLMFNPKLREGQSKPDFLMARGGDQQQATAYTERLLGTLSHAVRRAGLPYAHTSRQSLYCHTCSAPLLSFKSPMLNCQPCTMDGCFCPWWRSETHVTDDGKCEACGAQTPIVPMTADERRQHDQWRATGPFGLSVRTPVKRENHARQK